MPLRVSHPEDWLPCMEIVPFQPSHLPEAAALFVENFRRLRAQIAALPDGMEDAGQVAVRLEALADSSWAAVEQGKLIGYLGAYVFERFRDTERKGAFCPEWGHAALETAQPAIYRALYRAAAARWAALGDYGGRGFTRCAVDFESFNPEAAVFWMKYFTPVCLSVMRVPETAGV
jgi:hypothetical protein